MRNVKTKCVALFVSSLLCSVVMASNDALTTAALSRENRLKIAVEPAAPVAGQPVGLLIDMGDFNAFICQLVFRHAATRVSMADNVIQVAVAFDSVSPPPVACPQGYVTLGSFPQGDYQVVLDLNFNDAQHTTHEFSFTVADPHAGDVHFPAHDYSGIYWHPLESGNALQVTQTAQGSLAATVHTYNEDGRADWFVMGAGRWESPDTWTGPVWRAANGWPFLSPGSPGDAHPAQGTVLGEGRLQFEWLGGLPGDFCQSVRIQLHLNDESRVSRVYSCFAF